MGEVTDRDRGCDPSLSICVTSLISSGQTSASSVGARKALETKIMGIFNVVRVREKKSVLCISDGNNQNFSFFLH